jgi:hypothetical protein
MKKHGSEDYTINKTPVIGDRVCHPLRLKVNSKPSQFVPSHQPNFEPRSRDIIETGAIYICKCDVCSNIYKTE